MRQIGTVDSRPEAQRLAAYLLTRGIRCQLDAEGERIAIWVYDEDQIPAARADFAKFLESPDAPEFIAAEEAASKILEEQLRRQREQPRMVDLRERWQRPAPASQLITMLLLAASIGITLWTDFGGTGDSASRNPEIEAVVEKLKIATPRNTMGEVREEGLSEIYHGQVWRLFTPIFLHFQLTHILFNMMWLYDLGMLIEFRRGKLRFIAIVLIIAAVSNLGQYWWQYWWMARDRLAPMEFGGMSGVIYGLLGYAWMKSRYYPATAVQLSPNTVIFSIVFLVICMLGWMGNIANAAHFVGFVVGIILGLVPFL